MRRETRRSSVDDHSYRKIDHRDTALMAAEILWMTTLALQMTNGRTSSIEFRHIAT
jgi:hypothetical protein